MVNSMVVSLVYFIFKFYFVNFNPTASPLVFVIINADLVTLNVTTETCLSLYYY